MAIDVWSRCHPNTTARFASPRAKRRMSVKGGGKAHKQVAGLMHLLRGAVHSTWRVDERDDALVPETPSGDADFFHHEILRIAAASHSLQGRDATLPASFRSDAPTGLKLVHVYSKNTGLNWVTVTAVGKGSTAECKRVTQGMMLYRIDGHTVPGMSVEKLQSLDLKARPVSLEFVGHVDDLAGDWRYQSIMQVASKAVVSHNHHFDGFITNRAGLHRRRGGNEASLVKDTRRATSRGLRRDAEVEDVDWRTENQFLNGSHKLQSAQAAVGQTGPVDPDAPVLAGKALGFIEPADPVRQWLFTFMARKDLDHVLLVCILFNSVMLAVQSPTNTLGNTTNDILNIVDIVLSVIFSLEMIGRVIALGLWVGPTTYLRNPWNVLDFVVVMGIWIQFTLWLSKVAGGANVSFLRTARALRPLRSMRHFTGVKRIMSSLKESTGLLIGVTGMLMFCFAVFATVGTQIFTGALTVQCAAEDIARSISVTDANGQTGSGSGSISGFDANTTSAAGFVCPSLDAPDTFAWDRTKCPGSIECDGTNVDDIVQCVKVPKYGGGEYSGEALDEIHFYGFDDSVHAMMTLFIVTTQDEWPAMALPVRRGDNYLSWVTWSYFSGTVLITGIVVANLFIAVVTLAFSHSRNHDTSGFTGADIKAEAQKKRKAEARQKREERRKLADLLPEELAEIQRKKAQPFPFIAGISPKFKTLCMHPVFDGFIMLIVLANTGLMASEHHGQSPEFKRTIDSIELVFFVIYVTEAILKIVGIGTNEYFKGNGSYFNILDFSLVTMATVQYIVELMFDAETIKGLAIGRLLRLMRLMRAARMLRLLRRYKSVMTLISTVTSSGAAIANVVLFISILVIILSIMGLQLYGADVHGWEVPRANFHDFPTAALTVYQIFTGEDWSPIMFAYMHAFGEHAGVFFVMAFVVTNFALANLFVAVILENFEVAEENKIALQQEMYKRSDRYLELFNEHANDPFSAATDMDEHEGWQHGLSLRAKRLHTSVWFSQTIMFSIILSAAALAVEGPPNATYLQDQEMLRDGLAALDMFLFVIFWIEALLKIADMGLNFKDPNSYLMSSWNQLDFFIVVTTTVDFVSYHANLGDDWAWTGVFRTFRVLRPLRMVHRHENIRVVMESLLSSAGAVSATLGLASFIFLVFGILSINLFGGRLYSCCPENVLSGCEDMAQMHLDKVACLDAGLFWVNRPQNFDNMIEALQSLFVVSTLEGWVDIMNTCLDITDVDLAPSYNATTSHAVFFVVFTLLGGFFITNLFVGVLVEQFLQSSGTALLTAEQEKWARFEMMCQVAEENVVETREDIEKTAQEMKGPRKLMYTMAKSNTLDWIITVAILGNVVLMLLERYPQPEYFHHALEVGEQMFVVVYTAEILIKITGVGWFAYWQVGWHKLDLVIVLGTWATMAVGVRAGIQGLRTVRILRLVMIYGGDHGIMKSIVHTIIMSIPPAINVFLALMLVVFMYAVAGMQLYGDLPQCSENKISELDNFSNIGRAMMLLFQIATGQDFISFVNELRFVHKAPIPFFFFGSFYVMSIFVFLNLFVAVLLEKFEREFGDADDDLGVTAQELRDFQRTWIQHIQGLNLPPNTVGIVTRCINGSPAVPDMPIRHLRNFVQSLPAKWVLATCRFKLPANEWFNKILLAMEEEEDHPGWHVSDVHTALVSEEVSRKSTNRLSDSDPRRTVMTPMDDDGRPILDHLVSFTAVAHALMTLAKPGHGLGGLNYAAQVRVCQLCPHSATAVKSCVAPLLSPRRSSTTCDDSVSAMRWPGVC
jgi:hypothetical protein